MRHRWTVLTLPFVIVAVVSVTAADIPNDPLSIAHALNRLTFGARPGDVERVRREGLAAWIDRQLAPAGASRPDPPYPSDPPDPPGATPKEMRRLARGAVDDLAAAKLRRAITADRQLEEVLVDFWFNHFNVFAGKGRTAIYLPSYERDAIRPHVLGRFRDLLGATARHPAMLFYLDNARSRRDGLNENYARELLELHTLGVDAGYTQDDIVDVARAFTGWTIGAGGYRGDAGFRFARAQHDTGPKTVLGTTIRGGGVGEGERVLDLLAAHPATARHIATKLARRFVGDQPPPALVERAAARFRETNGDLREVVRTIVTSPEFFAAEARNAKVKTPLEFVVSAVRLQPDTTSLKALVRALRELGMPLYLCQPPTGYDDTAETWISSGALVARMNIAQQIAGADASRIGAPEFQKR